MKARPEFRDRDEVQVEVLDALVARAEEGMTVFELRAHVEVDIDSLEHALETLKQDGLIDVEESGEAVRIRPDDRVVPNPGEEPTDEYSLLDTIRDRLGL